MGCFNHTLHGWLDINTGVSNDTPMRKIGEVLDRTNRNLARVVKVRSRWAEIAGDVLASHTEPVLVRSGKLHVLCDSPAWVQQVKLLSGYILERIVQVSKVKVSGIEAAFGTPRKAPEPRQKERATLRFEIDPEAIERIKDPQLAERIRALAQAASQGQE